MDAQARLYAFPYQKVTLNGATLTLNSRYRRWVTDLGEYPKTSPIVGADGFISVGVGGSGDSNPKLDLVRPDGAIFVGFSLDKSPLYYPAAAADRSIFVTTANPGGGKGRLYHLNEFCDFTVSPGVCDSQLIDYKEVDSIFSGPPLLAYDAVYAGASNGKVYKFDPVTLAVEATYTADSGLASPVIAGPGGRVLFVTTNGTLYSLTSSLTLAWKTGLGAANLKSIPAASIDAIYLVYGGYLRAFNPNSGALKWKRSLNSSASGSASVGYGREVYVQTTDGTVKAFNEGWVTRIARITATAGNLYARPYFHIDLLQSLPPISSTLQTTTSVEGTAAAAETVGILLQRSADGGPWEDVTVLPPGTEVYTDTQIQPDTSYAYRAQILMSDGMNSDFETTLEVGQSDPDLPAAPVLTAVQAAGANALSLSWTEDSGSVVDSFRVERSLNQNGPFTAVFTGTAGSTGMTDEGLDAATTYSYRVVAVNATGESSPSNVLSGTTRSLTLDAPKNFKAVLSGPGQIRLTWDAGPDGATTVIEMMVFGSEDYILLGTTPAGGSFTFNTSEEGAYNFRIKFVKGNEESGYAKAAGSIEIAERSIYIPMIIK
jgi:hypothetical protein